VNAERTDGESVADLAESDACVCASVPLGVDIDALFVVREVGLFTGVDGKVSCGDATTVGGEEVATAPGEK
jgi:hypothetical protein